jgi:hypothetical protein
MRGTSGIPHTEDPPRMNEGALVDEVIVDRSAIRAMLIGTLENINTNLTNIDQS